jgi:type I restriction enzyme S subunit
MAGKYQAYSEYKDSEVNWIGGIPVDWTKTRINTICSFQKGFGLAKGDLSDDGSNPCILYGELYTAYKGFNEILKVNSKTDADIGYSSEGDEILIPGSTTTTGIDLANANYLPHKGVLLGGDIIILKPRKEYNKRFVSYFITNVNQREFIRFSKGVTIYHIYASSIKDMPIFLPDLEDQNHIANFLDHETAKIDTLIEKQQQLIKLLKEKRQAVISHAVTKGLNPNAPMRDSGVEWLGEVPEHWQVTRAKYVSKIFVPQRNKPEFNDDYGVAWATMEDMKGKYIEDTKHRVDTASAKIAGSKTLKAGSVIASCVGNFGVASINKIDVIINQQLQAFIPNGVKAEYLRETVAISKNYFELIGTAATLVYVNQQGFENLPVLVPTTDEQEKICGQIETECYKFDKLISLSEEAIGLIQDRRTALISAAVTGKIDVRSWQAPEPLHNPKETHKEEAA